MMKAFKKHHRLILSIAYFIILLAGATFALLPQHRAASPTTKKPAAQKTVPPEQKAPAPQPKPAFIEPVAGFRSRITKKFFGTYVTPANSPVQPERFTGYHAGVDVEYGDVSGTVPVHAIAAGQVVYAGWVSGYGGLIMVRHQINGAPHIVLYGHLNVASLLPVGTNVIQGQKLGELGIGYSRQTDGERRHLHFAILAGNTIDYRGYATAKAGLSAWINPLTLSYGA